MIFDKKNFSYCGKFENSDIIKTSNKGVNVFFLGLGETVSKLQR